MPYKITAIQNGIYASATRTVPASAAALAQKWIEAGYDAVQIIADGRPYDVDTFCHSFVRRKRCDAPARAAATS